MATASYQVQNNYDEQQFRPFELNYEAQLKELGAKNQYWMEGVNKIQSAYSKITGLNPQWSKNKEALKSFNEAAKEKIKKIASTDLGIQGNAEQVNDVIAPLYDMTNPVSEGIILDDYANKTGQSLIKTIESYKTKDKGIYYSPTNEKYALEWYQDYIKKSRDPNASLDDLRRVRENMKGYTPYHDYSKSVMEAIKNCPENSSTTVRPNGSMYFETRTTKTKDVGPCVESMLNSQDLTQMNIDGYVQFGKDYQSLGNKVLELSSKKVNNYSIDLGKIAARLTEPNVSPQEREALVQQQNEMNSELDRLNTLNGKISSGDYSDIEKNYETYAGLIHRTSVINNLGRSFSKHIDDIDIKENAVGMLEARLQHEATMDYNDKLWQTEENRKKEEGLNNRALLTYMSKGQKEPLPEIVTPGLSDDKSKNIVTTKESFLESGKNIKNSLHDTETQLFSYIYANFGGGAKLDTRDPKQIESFVRTILENNPKAKADKNVQTYLNDYEKKKMNVDLWNTLYNNINENIQKDIKSNLDLTGNIVIQNFKGESFSMKKSDIINNIIVKEDPYGLGKAYYIKNNKGNLTRVRMTQDILNIAGKGYDISTDHYAQAVTPTTMLMSNENMNLDDKNIFRNQLLTAFSSYIDPETKKPSITKVDDIRLGRTDWQGKIEVTLPGVTNDEGLTRLRSLGYNDAKMTTTGNFIVSGVKDFVSPNADKMLPTVIQLSMDKIKNTSYPPQQEVPILSTYKNKFKVYTKKSTPGMIYVRDLTKGVQSNPVYSTENISELEQTLLGFTR